MSISDFPGIGMVDLSKYFQGIGFSGKTMNSTRIDQLYLNAILDLSNNSEVVMRRWSLVEFMVRLGKDRYMERK